MHAALADQLPLSRVPQLVVRPRVLELLKRVDVFALIAGVLFERGLRPSGQ